MKIKKSLYYLVGLLFTWQGVWADEMGGALPWEGPLQKIMQSISGPVAKIVAVIVIVIAGLGIAFGESGSGVRRLFQIVFGLAIAFGAASIVSALFVTTAPPGF